MRPRTTSRVLADDNWQTKASLPTGRSEIAVAELDGKVYVMGGYFEETMSTLNQVYDSAGVP